jgi:hypothetical protein
MVEKIFEEAFQEGVEKLGTSLVAYLREVSYMPAS